MLARRLLILLAVLLGLTALASGVAPREPAPSPTPQASAPATGGASTEPREAVVDAAASQPARIVVELGERVTLEVRADALDSVSLDGLDAVEVVDPDSPARFELLAETAGTYAIRLVDADRELGTLEVR